MNVSTSWMSAWQIFWLLPRAAILRFIKKDKAGASLQRGDMIKVRVSDPTSDAVFWGV